MNKLRWFYSKSLLVYSAIYTLGYFYGSQNLLSAIGSGLTLYIFSLLLSKLMYTYSR